MLKIFLHVDEQRLKVREAAQGEELVNPIRWGNLEFSYTENSNFMMLWSSLLPDLSAAKARALIALQSDRYPVSPRFEELKKMAPPLVYTDSAPEWVFYGGSFNPWHNGHQASINLMPDDKPCFVLPDINPHKPLRDFDLTITVLELSTRIRLKKNQFLVPTFLMESQKNPTVNWIERLKNSYPDKELSLLMGFDSFAAICTWTRCDDLLTKLSRVYVVSRQETDQMREEARRKVPNLEVIFLGRHEYEDISSTQLRQK